MLSPELEEKIKGYKVVPWEGTPEQAENWKTWISDLRSGEYSQCDAALKRQDSFCCLGVQTNRYILDTGLTSWKDEDSGDGVSPHSSFPPEEVSLYFSAPSTRVREGGSLKALISDSGLSSRGYAHLNDGRRLTFSEIADIAEESLRLGTEVTNAST